MYSQWKKKILRRSFKLLKALPRSLRDPIVRAQLNISDAPLTDIEIKMAETKEEYEAAYKLLHDTYFETKLIDKANSGLRVTKYHSLPTTNTIIVKFKGEVVGTMSIIIDNPFGLPIDKVADISELRKVSARIAEISSLAIKKDTNMRRGKLLIPLTTYMHRYLEEIAGVDAMVCVVNESAKLFYESVMCFNPLPVRTVDYDYVNAKEICPIYAPITPAQKDRIRKAYDGKPPKKNMYYQRYVATAVFEHSFPSGEYNLATTASISKENFNYFFKEKTQLLNSFDESELSVLKHTYVHPHLTEVLPGSDSIKRKNMRYPVNCNAKIASFSLEKILNAQVLESSVLGFSFYTKDEFNEDEEFEIQIQISNSETVKMRAKVCWANTSKNRIGAVISGKIPDKWVSYQDYLKKNLYPDLDKFEQRLKENTDKNLRIA